MNCAVKLWTNIAFFPLSGAAIAMRLVRLFYKEKLQTLLLQSAPRHDLHLHESHSTERESIAQFTKSETFTPSPHAQPSTSVYDVNEQLVSAARRSSDSFSLRVLAGALMLTLVWVGVRAATDHTIRRCVSSWST